MVKARAELVLDHPFFASLALRLELVEDSGCETAWSNGRVLAFNPRYIEALPLEKVKGLQGHEVMHLACGHHTRRRGRDRKLWNMACDYAINWILLDAGLELPSGFFDDPAYRDMSVDKIYSVLSKKLDEFKGGADSGDQAESWEEEDDDPGGIMDSGQDQEDVEQQEQEGDEAGDQGEAAGRDDEEGEQDGLDIRNGDPGKSGEIRDAVDKNGGPAGQADMREIEDMWRISLSQAVQRAKAMGDLPAGLERLVSEIIYPKLNWREILRRFINSSARNDYSWIPPNRRYIHKGLYLPSPRNEELPEIVVAVDTSGSVTQTELDGFSAELSAILEDYDTRLKVLYCDAGIAGVETFGRFDLPLELHPKGGGGTDFRPPFDWVEDHGEQPACLIYLTDMECNRFPEEPAYPVLWVRTKGGENRPPFGELLEIT